MGQVPDDLNDDELPAVEAEVDALRERTQQIVAELERRLRARAAQAKDTFARVKRATDVRAQIKAHPRLTIGVSSVAAIALGLGVYVAVVRRIEARKPMNRLKGRLRGYRALLAGPTRVPLRRESIGGRLLAAVLIAGATTIVRGLGVLLVKRAIEPRMLPAERRRLLPPAAQEG